MRYGRNLRQRGPATQKTWIQRAVSILRRFGANAHVYIPGVGVLNGLQAGNYLDSAGTTQGTVDQPVGLVLDAAGGLGPNVVVNGGFETAANWSLGLQTTVAGGKATIASTGAASSLGQLSILNATSTYLITWDAVVRSGTAKLEASGGGTFTVIDSTKSYSCYFTGTTSVVFNRVNACDIDIDNVVAQEVTGIAASQPTTASKPILRRGAVNLLTYSQDFTNAAWVGSTNTATFAPNTYVAPDGTLTADSITVAGSTSNTFQLASTGLLTGKVFTFAVWLWSMSGKATIAMRIYDSPSGINAAIKTINLTTTPTLYTLTSMLFTTPDSTLACGFENRVAQGGDGIAGTFEAWGAALFQGTYTAAQIQALGGIPLTTTAPASTALGSYFWQFDGVNDSLALSGPLFQMSDDHCVIAGGSTNGVGYPGLIGVEGTSTDYIGIGFSTSSAQYFLAAGGTPAGDSTMPIVVGVTSVISGRKVGTTARLRVNGINSGTTMSTVSSGANAMTSAALGRESYGGGTQYLNGRIYPAIAIKGTVTDADLLTLERFVGSLSGVAI